jgi:hypothetical protein
MSVGPAAAEVAKATRTWRRLASFIAVDEVEQVAILTAGTASAPDRGDELQKGKATLQSCPTRGQAEPRKKRSGDMPTERRTIAAKALGLA